MVTTSMYNNNDGLNDANAILINDNARVVMDNTNDNVELVETLSINTTSSEGSMVSDMPFIFKDTQYVKLPARLEHDMQIIKNVWAMWWRKSMILCYIFLNTIKRRAQNWQEGPRNHITLDPIMFHLICHYEVPLLEHDGYRKPRFKSGLEKLQ